MSGGSEDRVDARVLNRLFEVIGLVSERKNRRNRSLCHRVGPSNICPRECGSRSCMPPSRNNNGIGQHAPPQHGPPIAAARLGRPLQALEQLRHALAHRSTHARRRRRRRRERAPARAQARHPARRAGRGRSWHGNSHCPSPSLPCPLPSPTDHAPSPPTASTSGCSSCAPRSSPTRPTPRS